MEKVNSTMGSRFKQVRVELNMRQGDFASEIQSSQGHVSDIENGRKNDVRQDSRNPCPQIPR